MFEDYSERMPTVEINYTLRMAQSLHANRPLPGTWLTSSRMPSGSSNSTE